MTDLNKLNIFNYVSFNGTNFDIELSYQPFSPTTFELPVKAWLTNTIGEFPIGNPKVW